MIAVKPTEVREHFKTFCEKVVNGETIIVSRPRNENVVIVSEKEFNDLQKDKRNADYLKKIEQGFQDITDGKGRAFSMEELDAMAGE